MGSLKGKIMTIFRKSAATTIACGLLGVLVSLFWVKESATRSGSQIDYHTRELHAPKRIKSRLQELRKKAEARKWRFTVGYTSAMDYALPKITGIRLPQNVSQLVEQQNTRAMAFLQQTTPKVSVPSECSPGAANFDWRKFNGATPVRDQGACGSCWAFGTISAFEASWWITNGDSIDASEQDVLDCSRLGSCSGGWWAFNYLINNGAATEASYPYKAKQGGCSDSVARPYKAASWGYVDTGDISDRTHVGRLKEALCKFGPLAVTVLATDAFQAYIGGDVFDECASGEINHAVTLIGWDDGRQAWLIKNSWGTGWGDTCGHGSERGYMWIAYGCNKIGAYAAWVYAQPKKPAEVEDYEVTMFERRGLAGKSLVYSLPAGLCQKLEPQFEKKMGNKIASIKVGSKVGIALFERPEYGGSHLETTGDVADLGARKYSQKPASLIVYRKEDGGPIGVRLVGSKTAFYPLTESCTNSGYSKLLYSDDATRVIFSGFQARPKWREIRAVLYGDSDFKGKMQAFPAVPGGDQSFEVGKDLTRKSSSLAIEVDRRQ
jgi:cathepsin L